jgi:hypothetical protein
MPNEDEKIYDSPPSEPDAEEFKIGVLGIDHRSHCSIFIIVLSV